MTAGAGLPGAAAPAAVAVVIPANDEADRIADTVAAAAQLPHVELVVVVDDGSTDATAQLAASAGADVVRHPANRGKAAAMTTGAARVAAVDAPDRPHALLFIDADLVASAAGLAPLIPPVLSGKADVTVANIPRENSSRGGGRAVRMAQREIARATGVAINQPLNGMRCLTRPAFDAALPLAPGWGVEVGLLLAVLRAGLRVQEVPVSFTHRASGTDWRGRLHRAKQLRDIARVVAASRRTGRRTGG
ncbi:MAG: glycosyltransferase [Tetrasphaera sp.]